MRRKARGRKSYLSVFSLNCCEVKEKGNRKGRKGTKFLGSVVGGAA
jgi:hypothetical protein